MARYAINRVKNPRAANDLARWTANTGTTMTRVNTDGVSGGTSVDLATTGATGSVNVGIQGGAQTCSPGAVVAASCAHKPIAAGGADTEAQLSIDFLDSGAVLLQSTVVAARRFANLGTWSPQRLSGIATAPANTAFVYVKPGLSGTGGGTVRVTDVAMDVNPKYGFKYVAGDQPDCLWFGTAHDAISIGPNTLEPPAADFMCGVRTSNMYTSPWPTEPLIWDVFRDLRDLADLGARAVRFGIDMATIAPTAGTRDWSKIDPWMKAYRKKKIKVCVLGGKGPAWMTPSVTTTEFNAHTYPPDPAFYDDWAGVVAEFVTRYKDLIIGVECWNEPNHRNFWYPQPDATAYGSLLATLYPAVKAVSSSIPVIGGVLANIVSTSLPTYISLFSFLNAIYNTGHKNDMDAISVHPYPNGASTGPYPGGSAFEGFSNCLKWVRYLREQYSDPNKPIWVTEVGMSTDASSITGVVNEAQQGFGLRLLLDLLAEASDVKAMFVHRLQMPPGGVDGQRGYEMIQASTLRRKWAFWLMRQALQPVVATAKTVSTVSNA